MAFRQPIAFEVDLATGNDNNGGGFDDTSGVPGTNRAWGANQLATSVSDIVCSGAGSTFTSATITALTGGSAAAVGNVIKTSSGTNLTTGRFQIISQSAGTFTVDRAISTGAVAAGVGIMGGSLLTIQEGMNAAFISAGAIVDCRVYVKYNASPYTSTTGLVTAGTVAPVGYRDRVTGYFSAHEDNPMPESGHQPVFQVGSGAGVIGLNLNTNPGYNFNCITFDGTATSGTQGTTGISVTATTYNRIFGCKIMNFSAEAYNSGGASQGYSAFVRCEVTGCGGTTATVIGDVVLFCYIHKNSKTGILGVAQAGKTIGNVIANNTGSTSDGISTAYGNVVMGNVIYGNGRDGIRTAAAAFDAGLTNLIYNNIIAKNGVSAAGFGLNITGATPPPLQTNWIDYNAFYSNNSGDYSTHIVAGAHDVSVSINPFNSSDVNLAAETSPDWGLNNTANAGAALRAKGYPGNLPDLTTSTGYLDIGTFQHQDSGGGAAATLGAAYS